MSSLTDEEKRVLETYPIGSRLGACREDILAVCPTSSESFETIINSGTTDIQDCIEDVLHALSGLPVTRWVRSHNEPSRTLREDIRALEADFKNKKQLNTEVAARLLERLVNHEPSDDESILRAVYDLVSYPIILAPQSTSSSPVLDTRNVVLGDLRGDWNRDYFSGSLEVLRQQVRRRKPGPYYSKTLVFLQSSGMGKSRLADAFGKTCPMINFNLRLEGTEGYPPADTEILRLMHNQPTDKDLECMTDSPKKNPGEKYPKRRADNMWNHGVVVALLRASFEHLNEWVEKQRDTKMSLGMLAESRHKMMAPVKSGVWDDRSEERVSYCNSVVSRAAGYTRELISNQTWRRLFNKDRKSDVRKGLLKSGCLGDLTRTLKHLIQNLREFERMEEKGEPSLVVVFDEAANLFLSGDLDKPQPGLYVALNRIFSCLRDYDVWFFILSTESQVERLLPPEQVDPEDRDASTRYGFGDNPEKTPLKIFPPFVALQLDVEDRRLMQSKPTKELSKAMAKLSIPEQQLKRMKELSKNMAQFSTPEHMKMFGRPLWFAYTDPEEMAKLAGAKLIGGKEGPYNPKNVDQVFAALSFRISLDLCLENPRTLALARTAVNYHMRIVVAVYQDIEALDTFTPSEPVVSEAAIRYLCEPKEREKIRGSDESEESGLFDGNIPKLKWSTSIKTLAQKLLQDGVIEKGTKGELYSRLILVLARDCVHLGGSLALKPTGPFTVEKFLMALYAEEHHRLICAIEPCILNALMNFTHFTSTEENLHLDVKFELCHDLLRRSAALQLAFNQPTYDHLIPIYFGEADETFEPSRCGVILVQVKNKERATTPYKIFREEFDIINPKAETPTVSPPSGLGTLLEGEREATPPAMPETQTPEKSEKVKPRLRDTKYFCFNEMMNPILFLLLDLGVAKPDAYVQVSHSDRKVDPCIWAIHSQGHGGKVFGCVKSMGCAEVCKSFYAYAAPRRSPHDKLSYRNKIFRQLSRNFRYKAYQGEGAAVKTGAGTGTADGDGDVQMADA